MAQTLLSVTELAKDRAVERVVPTLPPTNIELHLLAEWPPPRSRPQWMAILAASIAVHFCLFLLAIRLRSFIHTSEQQEERRVVRRVILYTPRDILTQKAPNRQKLSKSIDLADLLAQPQQAPQRAAPEPSVRHFELPKQNLPQPAKTAPQILPDAPKIAINQPPTPTSGALNGIGTPAPPPPAPVRDPFQNVGSDTPLNPHPTLAPPKVNLQNPVNGVTQNAGGRKLSISDDSSAEPMPGAAGATGQPGAPHAAVELESDPQGADFKPYLMRILGIVRSNWRRVIPESVRMGTLRGRTVVEFIINRDGSIPKLVTADSSGSDPLDRAAIAGLSMSNPLPPLPSDYKGFQVRLAFTFSYNMPSQ